MSLRNHLTNLVAFNALEAVPTTQDPTTFIGLKKFRTSVDLLQNIPGLERVTEFLKGTPLFTTTADKLQLQQGAFLSINEAVQQIKYSVPLLIDFLNSIVPPAQDETVRIRLPDSNDFKGVINDSQRIELALEQVLLNPQINGSIKLVNWEKGSYWIELYLGSAMAAALVGKIAWAAIVIWKEKKKLDLASEVVRSLKIENNAKEAVAEGQRVLIKSLVDAEAHALGNEFFSPEPPAEQIERLKQSIREFGDLIDRGAEFRPTIMDATKTSEAFPNFDALESVSSRIKQLTNESGSQT